MTGAPTNSRAGWAGWILAPGIVVIGLLLWRMYCTIERVQWNAPRLAPSFALAGGVNFYGTRTAGPFLGWIYGPVFPLYLLPAAAMPGLDGSFAVAWLLNFAAFLLPAWLLARLAFPSGPGALLAVGFWMALSLAGEVSGTQFYYLHVDTLCVGLIVIAAWALIRAVNAPAASGWLHGAALAAALAIWTKQSAAAVPIIGALWLGRRGEGSLARRFFGWTLLYAATLGAIFVAKFGFDQLWFNLVVFHLHNPMRTSGLGAFFGQLLASSPGWLVAGFVLVLTRNATGGEAAPAARGDIESLLLWLAVGSLPLGLLAAIKVAGGWNSLHSLNFALLALALALARRAASIQIPHPAKFWFGVAFAAPLATGWLAAEGADLRWQPGQMQSADLTYARTHPGRLYLPWNPLITFVTDRKLYPFDDALLCLERAGLEPPLAAVRRDIPRGALIVYPDPVQSQFALRYLASAPAGQP